MLKLVIIGALCPLLSLTLPLGIADLKTNNLANLLFNLYQLRSDIRAQTIRPDLTDAYIGQLINDTYTEITPTGENFHAKPSLTLIAKAEDYYRFLKSVTKDFPPVTSPGDMRKAELLAEGSLINLEGVMEDENYMNTRTEDSDPYTETSIRDDEDGYTTPEDESSYTLVSDPSFRWSPRAKERTRSNKGQSNDYSSFAPSRNIDDDSEEEKIGPPPAGVRRKMLIGFEEEADQTSSEEPGSPFWYGGNPAMNFELNDDEYDDDVASFAARAAGV
ncbi:hypothetical protein AA313_de0203002 [Arthrobotrys entomopaga]|nr:hypothetical protein AA313_de0203002 [Arthrobotrys entomopaga]